MHKTIFTCGSDTLLIYLLLHINEVVWSGKINQNILIFLNHAFFFIQFYKWSKESGNNHILIHFLIYTFLFVISHKGNMTSAVEWNAIWITTINSNIWKLAIFHKRVNLKSTNIHYCTRYIRPDVSRIGI